MSSFIRMVISLTCQFVMHCNLQVVNVKRHLSTAHISKPFFSMPECAKSHLQQSIISKFSGGGPPDPPLRGEGRGRAGGRKGGVEGRPRLKRGRGKGGEGREREGRGR